MIEAILCNGIVEVTARTKDVTPLALGRDGAVCTVAGCVSRYRLQVHHTIPWSQGGQTDPENLSTVCWFHHLAVIHSQGFTIDPNTPPQGRRPLRPHNHAPPTRTPWRVA